jgi:hypothetical protein
MTSREVESREVEMPVGAENDCHSERSEESRSDSLRHRQGKIPRSARNDSQG